MRIDDYYRLQIVFYNLNIADDYSLIEHYSKEEYSPERLNLVLQSCRVHDCIDIVRGNTDWLFGFTCTPVAGKPNLKFKVEAHKSLRNLVKTDDGLLLLSDIADYAEKCINHLRIAGHSGT